MKIIITGSLAFDFIMDFPGKFSDHILPEKIHEINLSFLVKTLKRQRGGTAGNMAYNLVLLGLHPTILATAGDDFTDYKKELDRVGVDTSIIQIIKTEPTASAFIFTDMVDNQITGFYPGAMKHASTYHISHITYHNDSFVVISPNDPQAMVNHVKDCNRFGFDYLFDPGMQLPRLSDKELKLGIEGAKIVVGNDYEMALISAKCPSARAQGEGKVQSAKLKLKVKNDQIWITTLGDKGSVIEVNDQVYKIPPARPREVLDPTGAGDACRAGFLAGYLRGLPIETCGRMGSVAAVYTVEKYGTQTHKFTISQFKKRYQENFGEELKW